MSETIRKIGLGALMAATGADMSKNFSIAGHPINRFVARALKQQRSAS